MSHDELQLAYQAYQRELPRQGFANAIAWLTGKGRPWSRAVGLAVVERIGRENLAAIKLSADEPARNRRRPGCWS